jgi:hypothetical protein
LKPDPMRIVIFGLSITSSWGNGHATTYRALVRELICGFPAEITQCHTALVGSDSEKWGVRSPEDRVQSFANGAWLAWNGSPAQSAVRIENQELWIFQFHSTKKGPFAGHRKNYHCIRRGPRCGHPPEYAPHVKKADTDEHWPPATEGMPIAYLSPMQTNAGGKSMRQTLIAILGCLTLLAIPMLVAAQGTYPVIPEGTNITVRLSDPLSTDNSHTGDNFRGILDQDVVVNGNILARAGDAVQGQLTDVEQSGRVSGRARMALTLTQIQTAGGIIPLYTNVLTIEADPRLKQNAGWIGGGAAIGAIIGAIAGGGKGAAIGAGAGAAAGTTGVLVKGGKDVTFDPEQRFNFITQQSAPSELPRSNYPGYGSPGGYPGNDNAGGYNSGYPNGNAPVPDLARTLSDRAQTLWQTVSSRRDAFRNYQNPDGYDLYMALGAFAHEADIFQQTANDFPRNYSARGVQRLINEAQQIDSLLSRTDATLQLRSDWRPVQDQLAALGNAFGILYRPSNR